MTALRLVALAAILVLGSGVHAEETVVEIANFTFNPPEVTVKPGATVTWKNADDIPHSVVEDNTAFRSKALDTGETFSMTFANAGEIGYFCGLHPHMKGKIIVRP
jgi:plastocyanin